MRDNAQMLDDGSDGADARFGHLGAVGVSIVV